MVQNCFHMLLMVEKFTSSRLLRWGKRLVCPDSRKEKQQMERV